MLGPGDTGWFFAICLVTGACLGADLVLDQRRGPVLLELNARPGLSIQIANGEGLLPRLRRIESLGKSTGYSVADRAVFAREHFAG